MALGKKQHMHLKGYFLLKNSFSYKKGKTELQYIYQKQTDTKYFSCILGQKDSGWM